MWWRQQRFTSLACLSSLVSFSSKYITFCSSSKPLFPSLRQPLNIHYSPFLIHHMWATCYGQWGFHSLSHMWHMKRVACELYLIILTVRTLDVRNVHRLLSSVGLAPITVWSTYVDHSQYGTVEIITQKSYVLSFHFSQTSYTPDQRTDVKELYSTKLWQYTTLVDMAVHNQSTKVLSANSFYLAVQSRQSTDNFLQKFWTAIHLFFYLQCFVLHSS